MELQGYITNCYTQFSGFMKQYMAAVLSIFKARESFLAAVMADTVLVGHSLEGNLLVLQLMHSHMVLQQHHNQATLGLPIISFWV